MNVILENFRSFAGRHEIELRPLTILTGENSTGKTSFLAALSLIFDPESFPLKPKFNQEPYALGGYDTIATSQSGTRANAYSFSLGFESETGDESVLAEYDGEMGSGRVRLTRFCTGSGAHEVNVALEEANSGTFRFTATGADDLEELGLHIGNGSPEAQNAMFTSVLSQAVQYVVEEDKRSGFSESPPTVAPGKSISLAPVRTSPKRTYERVNDEYHPAGRHVLSVLAKAFREPSQTELREDIRAQIQDFGSASGLFDDVRIRNLGDRPTDPFQVEVQRKGRWDNVVDVGYGVGQVLPILIEALTADSSDLLLLQQPEVHLHPRAQAELGSFLARTIAERDIQVVLETHSDYIGDRIRTEIAEDTLDADDAQLLFFEKEDLETTVHPIHFDGGGNVVDPPSSYRRFFMQEEIALLSRSIS